MCKSTGCCGSLFRAILIIINLVVFLIGAGIFALACVIKFTPQLAEVLDIPQVSSVVSPVVIFLFAFGGFLLLVSIFGLIGACCGNRCFLVLYEIVIGFLLVAHLIAFVFMVIMVDSVKGTLKKGLTDQVEQIDSFYSNLNISDPSTAGGNYSAEIQEKCKYYRIVATFVQCCDFGGNALLLDNCCGFSSNTAAANTTCVSKVFDPTSTNKYTSLILYLPNGVALGFELVIFVAVIYIIVRISKHKNRKEWSSTLEMADRRHR
jgi:hypothetical protein